MLISTLVFLLAEAFEPFLRAYIDKFKYKSITTSDWKAFLYEFFSEKVCEIAQENVVSNLDCAFKLT